MKLLALTSAALAAALLLSRPAAAVDNLTIGVATGSIFTTLDVGEAAGIWARQNLKIKTVVVDGEAPMDKGLASGDLDGVVGGGNSMAFRLKGLQDVAVAEVLGPPYDFALTVAYDSPIKSVAGLKGKTVAVTSKGSTTDFLVHLLSQAEGWGSDGMNTVGLGSTRARLSALGSGDVQAMMTTPELGYDSEEHKGSRVLVLLGDEVKGFLSHTILFRTEIVDKHPELVQRFLQGWFQTVAWMKVPENKAKALPIVAKSLGISETAAGRSYDAEMLHLSPDGAFVKAEVDAIAASMPAFGLLDRVPKDEELYTSKFVPVKGTAP